MAKIMISGQTDHPLLSDNHHLLPMGAEQVKISHEFASDIGGAEGYVILPDAEAFLTTSLFVDKQYASAHDPLNTYGKPVIVVHSDERPSPFVSLATSMQTAGMVKQPLEQLMTIVPTVDEVPAALEEGLRKYREEYLPQIEEQQSMQHATDIAIATDEVVEHHKNRHLQDPAAELLHAHEDHVQEKELRMNKDKQRPDVNIAVFCSASTKDTALHTMAFEVGQKIAERGYGLVWGLGNVAMMGKAAEGMRSKGYENTYLSGHTTDVFYLEEFVKSFNERGLSEEERIAEIKAYVDEVKIHPDIYVRMGAMFKESDALTVLPGGLGTVQELLACFHINAHAPEGEKKPILLVNENGFYDEVITILESQGYARGEDFKVLSNRQELDTEYDAIGEAKRAKLQRRPSTPGEDTIINQPSQGLTR